MAKTLNFEIPRSSGFTLSGLELRRPTFDPFRPKTLLFHFFFEGFQRFPKVSKGFRGFPTVSEGFPRASRGFQWFQMVSEHFDFSTFFDFSGPAQMLDGMHAWHACMPSNIWEGPEKSKKSKNLNVRKPSETIGNLRKPLETLRKPSESLRNPWKPLQTFENLQKMFEKTHFWNEMGQILVPGALDRTKLIRKTAADIFAIFGAEKPGKSVEQFNFSLDFSQFVLWV